MRLSASRAGAALAAFALLGGCAARPLSSASTAARQSILVASTPAAGGAVAAPVNELMLHFSPPARLGEVTVTGPQGTMPTMVTAVGEVEHYSLPLPGLGPGAYTVSWKAMAAGAEHRGSFSFSVR